MQTMLSIDVSVLISHVPCESKISQNSEFSLIFYLSSLFVLHFSLYCIQIPSNLRLRFALYVHVICRKYLFIYASGNQSSHSRDPKPFSKWVFGFILLPALYWVLSYVFYIVVDIQHSTLCVQHSISLLSLLS